MVITSKVRTSIRSVFSLGCNTSVPVTVIDGALPPKLLGSRGGHFTRGGTRIAHPGAYAKSGWSNMVYRCATRRIVVGDKWVAANVAG